METPLYKFALTPELITVFKTSLSFKEPVSTTLTAEDFLPTRSEPSASGWDVRCAEANGIDLIPGYYYKIPLGFRAFCPPGWWAELNPRSSTFLKRHCHALYGKVDETYPNQWFFLCHYMPGQWPEKVCNQEIIMSGRIRIEFGDRIGQIIPVKRQEMRVEKISNDEMDEEIKKRDAIRIGGLGSTGIS